MLSIEDIKNISFRKAGFGGYKPEDVDNFVDSIQTSYEEMMREKQNLILTIQKLEKEVKKFYEEENSIREVHINLKGITEKSLLDAETKAKDVVSKAAKTSEVMLSNAKKEVDMQKEISENLKKESDKLRKHLEDIYSKHMEIIREIPQLESVKKTEVEVKDEILKVAAAGNEADGDIKDLKFGPDYEVEEISQPYNKIFKK